MIIELNIEDPRWTGLDLEQISNAAFDASLAHLGIDAENTEISVLACSDAKITRLNTDFRAKPSATNILSWPANDLMAQAAGTRPDPPEPDIAGDMPLGDIAIAWETCQREAIQAGIQMTDHVTHLLVHAVLHLLGYDHIRDPDATLMIKNEVEILGKLGISNPY
ncbi:MAG: rRNA maturation RNase YbeY [Rhodobacteraceae bacterium]|nr:rRNA maturation RNase YbeY [Paracoccaceae bacterium]